MVHGDQSDDEDRIYLHRSIAARQFQRGFVIADGISVIDAELNNGLLYIDLNRPPPDSDIKIIEIKSHDGTEKNSTRWTISAMSQDEFFKRKRLSGVASVAFRNESVERIAVVGPPYFITNRPVSQQARHPRQRLQMISARHFWRQQQKQKVNGLFVYGVEINGFFQARKQAK